jgi:hypothetical protein
MTKLAASVRLFFTRLKAETDSEQQGKKKKFN